jgi:hypothetical protein
MCQITHEFTIERRIKGEWVEYELRAEFDIEPFVPVNTGRCYVGGLIDRDPAEGGTAELVSDIFLTNDGVPWDGHLTKKELERVENQAYEAWAEANEPPDGERDDDTCVLKDFDDGFDIDMAMKVAGKGRVEW